MREIKFRAWDTEEKKMIYYEPLTYGGRALQIYEVIGNIYEHPELLIDKERK